MFWIRPLVLPLALLVDRFTGDPHHRLHPVALLGAFIGWWGRPGRYHPALQRTTGVIMWVVTVMLFSLPFLVAELLLPWFILLIAGPILLKSCLAWRSLEEHALSVEKALDEGLAEGRSQVQYMVSRNPTALSREQVLSAAYESVSENLVDSIVSPLCYYAVFGLPGAAIYRAANTMDAMLGYRDERARLGWFSARADDVLNYIPARITAALLLCYFASRGRLFPALQCLRQEGRKRPGVNGGLPMAVMAGGTGTRFEKPGAYTIGPGDRTLFEAGPEILSAVRVCTLFLTLVLMMVLMFLALSIPVI
ncbi:MAG: adenosylcobinamide-phosphate synthase CbiB [Methanolinea sp.]|jgi:adenosylcobinamide-phosphate synthase|nr:adenosylcobinamide-phosphate synthase CbiB [Methanolinea sp.]